MLNVQWCVLLVTPLMLMGYKDEVGFTTLMNELGTSIPNGAGITVVQVEADEDGSEIGYEYVADTSNNQFAGKTFVDVTNLSTASSNHATGVARNFFGNERSMTPGIGTIYAYNASNWFGRDFLQPGARIEPELSPGEIFNHSWIGSAETEEGSRLGLARMDFVIARDNVTVAVGLNNGGSSQPELMVQGYNTIAVGLTSGGHSAGLTTLDQPGRIKPDIVAPQQSTSLATPIIASAAALLYSHAANSSDSNGHQPESIKAILMAGATKTEFPGWSQTSTQPLDIQFGAGELNIYNSYHILAQGEQSPFSQTSEPVTNRGWDLNQLDDFQSETYFFEVPADSVMTELSIVATWLRKVTLQRNGSYTASLENISIGLYTAANRSIIELLQQSDSAVDNVEHIYHPTPLGPGQYAISIHSAAADPGANRYALAWHGNIHTPKTFNQWQLTAFESSNMSAEEQGEIDNPDHDLFNNLLEYAFNLDPTQPDPVSVYSTHIVTINDQRFLQMTYRRRIQATDIVYAIGHTTDLIDFNWSEVLLEWVSTEPIDAITEWTTIRYTQPLTTDHPDFLVLRVSQ